MIAKSFSKSFKYFNFFQRYLGYRVYLILFLSLLVGLADGIGLALFIPLIQLAVGTGNSAESSQDSISSFILEHVNMELTLLNIFLLIFGFFCMKSIFKFFEIYLRVIYQQYFMKNIRLQYISLLDNYDYQKFVLTDAGRLQNSLSSEVQKLNIAYRQYFKTLQTAILVLVYIILALATDWKFSILVLMGGFVLNFVFRYFYKRTKYFSKVITRENHNFQGLLMQKINNFQYLKATGQNGKFSSKLKSKIEDIENYQQKTGIVEALLGAIREPTTIFIVFLSIFLYSYFFDEAIGGIILSLLLLYRSITFFISMQELWNLFLGVSGSVLNIENLKNELEIGSEKDGNQEFKFLKDKIDLKNISFSYHKKPVLKNINLEIHKNEIVAIVGQSGSGKTTLMNIIAGLLQPSKGSLFIDQLDMATVKLNSYKKKIGYIVQNPAIFNDTIFNNITFWDEKTEINLTKFQNSSKKAAIFKFIEEMPGKENTLLGHHGLNISGGQKQRLSIARELYKEVDILFMDEATSSLDSETESEIQKNISKLKGEYTIIIIAHRLATVKMADRILVLKDGKIDGIGSYNALLAENKEFRRMVELQEL
ncbi:ABC transporter ATP-binding protein [Gramella sp. AN32]|uniref:ABC transporter ATP-binding protein n=1 Tax=Christiangramia antarctica TaxID=2058158 RepID=A0ABW5X541_9FLAO|nr:ABC transporter ATP-binding protein [Gramella sp. AN32]MCM4157104.1 ABC transporter ATP-binding protein [Gramella sp. AN32]